MSSPINHPWFYGVRQKAVKINHKEVKKRHLFHSKHQNEGAKEDIKQAFEEMASFRYRIDAYT